ncbi:hypothetical protein V6N13_035147 [Hibiscus sabdariffa]
MFVAILWNLWINRNAKVFGSPCVEEGSVISRSVQLVHVMEHAHVNRPMKKPHSIGIATSMLQWDPPPSS